MSYQVSHPELAEELKKAFRANSFFITISHLQNGRIEHYWITQKFPKEDIYTSLTHFLKITEKERGGSVAGEPAVVKEKSLPPEYREPKNPHKED